MIGFNDAANAGVDPEEDVSPDQGKQGNECTFSKLEQPRDGDDPQAFWRVASGGVHLSVADVDVSLAVKRLAVFHDDVAAEPPRTSSDMA